MDGFEERLCRAEVHASVGRGTVHGIRLAGARLAVGKDARVEALEDVVDLRCAVLVKELLLEPERGQGV